jgi:hypothetical protein
MTYLKKCPFRRAISFSKIFLGFVFKIVLQNGELQNVENTKRRIAKHRIAKCRITKL